MRTWGFEGFVGVLFSIMSVRAVIFDLGDTVLDFGPLNPWDTMRAGILRVHTWFEERGIRVPSVQAYERRARRMIRRAYFRSVIRRREVDVIKVLDRLHTRLGIRLSRDELMLLVGLFYGPLRATGRAQPSTRGVLEELRANGLKLAIVSNTFVPGLVLDDHLAEWDLLRFFPQRVYSCDVGFMKPDERILEIVLDRLEVSADETLLVGDTPATDIRGANRLGMISVWRRAVRPRDRRYPARHEIDELTELPAIVERYMHK